MIHNPQGDERGGGLVDMHAKRTYQETVDLAFMHKNDAPRFPTNTSPLQSPFIKSFFSPKLSAIRQFYQYIMSAASSSSNNPYSPPPSQSTWPSFCHHKSSVVVVDTNCLLDTQQRDAVLGLKYYTQLVVVIPFIVLQELDGLKGGHGRTAFDARKAVQFLSDEVGHGSIWIRGQCYDEVPYNSNKLLSKNDDQILKCCLHFQELATENSRNSPHDVLLVTMDRMLQIKAKSHCISSLDGITLLRKLTDSWQETVCLGSDIYFRDGKFHKSPAPSRKQQQQQKSWVSVRKPEHVFLILHNQPPQTPNKPSNKQKEKEKITAPPWMLHCIRGLCYIRLYLNCKVNQI